MLLKDIFIFTFLCVVLCAFMPDFRLGMSQLANQNQAFYPCELCNQSCSFSDNGWHATDVVDALNPEHSFNVTKQLLIQNLHNSF